jgi:hypothetical protein
MYDTLLATFNEEPRNAFVLCESKDLVQDAVK